MKDFPCTYNHVKYPVSFLMFSEVWLPVEIFPTSTVIRFLPGVIKKMKICHAKLWHFGRRIIMRESYQKTADRKTFSVHLHVTKVRAEVPLHKGVPHHLSRIKKRRQSVSLEMELTNISLNFVYADEILLPLVSPNIDLPTTYHLWKL